MAHPQMFDDDDPVLSRLSDICLALPGADMKVSHGRPCFFTKKIFVVFGAVVKGDHDPAAHAQAMIFYPNEDEAPALREDDRFFVPAYYGPSGWLALDLSEDSDWDEVAELVEESYRATAGKRLIAELDSRSR